MLTKKVLGCLALVGLSCLPAIRGEACERARPLSGTQKATVHATYVTWHRVVPAAAQRPAPETVVRTEKATVEVVRRVPSVRTGDKIRIPLKFAGREQGVVQVKVGALRLNAKVHEWSNTHVVFAMPRVELDEEVPAQIEVLQATGEPVRQVAVVLEAEGIQIFPVAINLGGDISAAAIISTNDR